MLMRIRETRGWHTHARAARAGPQAGLAAEADPRAAAASPEGGHCAVFQSQSLRPPRKAPARGIRPGSTGALGVTSPGWSPALPRDPGPGPRSSPRPSGQPVLAGSDCAGRGNALGWTVHALLPLPSPSRPSTALLAGGSRRPGLRSASVGERRPRVPRAGPDPDRAVSIPQPHRPRPRPVHACRAARRAASIQESTQEAWLSGSDSLRDVWGSGCSGKATN